MLDDVMGGTVHESFAQGRCFICHDEHASDNDFQLIETGADNCYPCHGNIQAASEKSKYSHAPLKEGACTACHNPHGSKIKGQLNRPLGSLCLSCHSELEAAIATDPFQHMPAKEGMCLKCHVPHYANSEDLLAGEGASLCRDCHDDKEAAMGEAHHGIAIGRSDCTGCHESHTAETKGLIHRVMHAPFKEGNCVACHQ
jgi:predicted CXXCH cytochrome family protein